MVTTAYEMLFESGQTENKMNRLISEFSFSLCDKIQTGQFWNENVEKHPLQKKKNPFTIQQYK